MAKKPTATKPGKTAVVTSTPTAPPTFLPPTLTPQQYADNAAKAKGADRLITRIAEHTHRVKAMGYLRTLGDFGSYAGGNPAMELEGVRELLAHLGATTAPPGLIEELEAEVAELKKAKKPTAGTAG